MTGRRWKDTKGISFDAVRRVLEAAWPFVASVAAVATFVAATIVSVGAVKDRDRFLVVAANSAAAARDARTAAARADESAAGAKDAAATSLQLLRDSAPCAPGDPPTTPGCQRQARTEAFVAQISADLAKGIALHDANVHEDLEELLRRLTGGAARLPSRPSAAPAPSPTAPPPPAAPAPTPAGPTPPTTACETLPNGRCRK